MEACRVPYRLTLPTEVAEVPAEGDCTRQDTELTKDILLPDMTVNVVTEDSDTGSYGKPSISDDSLSARTDYSDTGSCDERSVSADSSVSLSSVTDVADGPKCKGSTQTRINELRPNPAPNQRLKV